MLPMDIVEVAQAIAKEHSWPGANLAAVVEVESNGVVFADVPTPELKFPARKPVILFEPHIFYRLLAGAERAQAVAEDLASPKWDKRLYAKTQAGRWEQLRRAMKINRIAALESASYGVGQVLGSNWKMLGFVSIDAFLKKMFDGARGQIEVMVTFILKNGLDDELKAGQWAAFARGYNGPAYKKNAYDTKMRDAALQYGGKVAVKDGMLRMGSKGARVRELQALLVRAGYELKVDADFGPTTHEQLKAFQRAMKIKVDGVYGPQTERALSVFRQGPEDKPGHQEITQIPEVQQGGGGLLGGAVLEGLQNKVDDATTQLQGVSNFEPWLGYGLAALSVIALGLAAWGAYRAITGWLKSKRTVEA